VSDPSTQFFLKTKQNKGKNYYAVKDVIKKLKTNTVCEEALCPNVYECFGRMTATFLILGNKCTRDCAFCSINKAREDLELDPQEPYRVAEAVVKLGLKYVVITSVTRDDLVDGGASFFAETISWIKKLSPRCLIEVLTPDFGGNQNALKKVFKAQPDVFNHNLEVVKNLYPKVRGQADYYRSLELLKKAKYNGLIVKSGLMVGLGESQQEIIDTMHDIRANGCDILTIGQYLRPTLKHHEVKRYYRMQEFSFLRQTGLAMNFKVVEAIPLARSSYKARESYEKVLEQDSDLIEA